MPYFQCLAQPLVKDLENLALVTHDISIHTVMRLVRLVRPAVSRALHTSKRIHPFKPPVTKIELTAVRFTTLDKPRLS